MAKDRFPIKPALYSLSSIYPPYHHIIVPAGGNAVIYDLRPEPYIAFIRYVANSWYPHTYLEWRIDNELIERIERQIGSADNPHEFRPEYVVQNSCTVRVFNNDTVTHSFWIVMDGSILLIPENI